jgi:gliding motility-associated-like protein
MMKNSKIGFVLFFLSLVQVALGQNNVGVVSRWNEANGIRFSVDVAENQFVYLDKIPQFLSTYFQLKKTESLVELRRFASSDNKLHIRYAHLSNGVVILGSEIIAHIKNGKMHSFNGILYPEVSGQQQLAFETAFELAKKEVPAEKYMWEDEKEEAMLKVWLNDDEASYLPKTNLVYAPLNLDFRNQFELCYVFEMYSQQPLAKKRIFVNAASGAIWGNENLLYHADANGVANTKYRGNRNIVTDSVATDTFRLRETTRGGGIETYNMRKGTSYAASVDFIDSDNYWNNYNANFDEVAGDAHYGAEITYDYFKDKFNRNSYDDNGAKIRSFVHYGNKYSNAFWNGYVMTYGDGNGTSVFPLMSIDVCAHEVSHAVTTNSANLVYSYESGALNESFSDIFGNAIEYYAEPSLANWRMGEDITASGNGLRNMANPKTHGDPDTYKGTYWHAAASDNGGVHTNSGVQNFWFYILCHGDTAVNDNGDNYAVDSIGIEKAEAIAYRNLTVYLTSSSDYEEARYYSIKSAADLFGECSDEVIITTNAWYAVGVGDVYDSAEVVADFEADTAFCFTSELVVFSNKSKNAKNYTWKFGDGDTSTQVDPVHQYPNQGMYSVELIAEGCFFGIMDTVVKTNYISIDSTRDICNALVMPFRSFDTIYACQGFLYDHGGESNYGNLARDTITIDFGQCDSAQIQFIEFAYEEDWDSIYIYDGFLPTASLIGGYTGFTLPNDSNPITIKNGALTIRHFSDTYVNESGFKAYFKSFRPVLSVELADDTLVCYKQNLQIEATGSGGSKVDYVYFWNGVEGDSVLQIFPERDTIIYLQFGDACLQEFVYDSIIVFVKDSLSISPISDTTICYLQDIALSAIGNGGDPATYQFEWLPIGVKTNPWNTEFKNSETIQVALSDGCTAQSDTVAFNVLVRDSISFSQSSDTILCQGNTIDITVDVNGGLNDFWFKSSEGNTSLSDTNFSINLAPTGSGRHSYWITFGDNCTETIDTAHFTVTMRDSLNLFLSADTTICFGSSGTIRASASGGIKPLAFDLGTGTQLDSVRIVNPKSSTTYTVKLSDGCSVYEPSLDVNITVLDSLAAKIVAKDTACFGESVQFDAVVSGGRTSTLFYNWDNGGISQAFQIAGIYSDTVLNLAVSDGCSVPSDTSSLFIPVKLPLALRNANDTSICLGDAITISPNVVGGTGVYNLNWDNGLGLGSTKTISPVVNTTYTIAIFDNCSQPLSHSIDVTVNPIPDVSFSADPLITCPFLPVQFINTSNAGAGSLYSWNFDDGNSSSLENPTHFYDGIGSFNPVLTVTNAFNCTASSDANMVVDIVASPVANFTFSPQLPDFLNREVQFENESSNATNYMWLFSDGGLSTNENIAYSFSDTGRYTATLIAQNDYGCADTLVRELRVKDVFLLHIPNAFTPNADGLNDGFRVSSRGIVSYNLSIFNNWGEILYSTQNPNDAWDGKYQGELVSPGLYFYTISGASSTLGKFAENGSIVVEY